MTLNVQAESLERNIIAFWDSAEFENLEYDYSSIHTSLEVVFNYYGYKLTYVDVRKEDLNKYKSEIKNKKYHGAVSWFYDNQMPDYENYLEILNYIIQSDKSYLSLGHLGFLNGNGQKTPSIESINRVFKKHKISITNFYQANPLKLKINYMKDSKLVEFERKLDRELFQAQTINNDGDKERTWLTIDVDRNKKSDVVIVGEKIGLVQYGYELYVYQFSEKKQWRVNPFELVKKVFGVPNVLPEVSEYFGHRGLFVHIDGDGFINMSYIDRTKICGETLYEKIFQKYKIPTTVSYVVAEIHPNILGSKKSNEIARKINKLDYVEVGSHTWSHPLSWALNPTLRDKQLYLEDEQIKKHKGPIVAYKIKKYKMTYQTEVIDSVDYLNNVVTSKDKKVKLIQWSGNCRPPKEALKIATDNNILNINGGDTKFDKYKNSFSGVSALYRKIGDYIQVYTANANENLYTNLWRGPYNGFKNLVETFENTASPYLLKPMNIYYHFYSGERISSLEALEYVYDYAIKQDPFYLYTTEFIQTIHGFIDYKVEIRGKDVEIRNYGKLRNFKLKLGTNIDIEKSQNIIGFRKEKDKTVVYLGKGDFAKIHLSEDEIKTDNRIISSQAYIENRKKEKGVVTYSGYANKSSIISISVKGNIKKYIVEKGQFELEAI